MANESKCPKCGGTQLVESGTPKDGKVQVTCQNPNCKTTTTVTESTRRKLMG